MFFNIYDNYNSSVAGVKTDERCDWFVLYRSLLWRLAGGRSLWTADDVNAGRKLRVRMLGRFLSQRRRQNVQFRLAAGGWLSCTTLTRGRIGTGMAFR